MGKKNASKSLVSKLSHADRTCDFAQLNKMLDGNPDKKFSFKDDGFKIFNKTMLKIATDMHFMRVVIWLVNTKGATVDHETFCYVIWCDSCCWMLNFFIRECGVDMCGKFENGCTPIEWGVVTKNYDAIGCLLQNNVDPNGVTKISPMTVSTRDVIKRLPDHLKEKVEALFEDNRDLSGVDLGFRLLDVIVIGDDSNAVQRMFMKRAAQIVIEWGGDPQLMRPSLKEKSKSIIETVTVNAACLRRLGIRTTMDSVW